MYQGFVRGKGFGQFGLQRLGKIPWICIFFPSVPKAPFWPGGGVQAGNVSPIPGLNFSRFPSPAELGVRFVGDKQHKTNSTMITFII